jgi:hypothetical protein
MNKALLRLLAVIAVATPLVACGKSSIPNPAGPSQSTYSLSGTVSGPAGDNGAQMLEGVDVTVTDGSASYSTSTDSNGAFSFSGLAAGDWTLHFTKSGFVDQTENVTVSGDTNASYSLQTDPAAATARQALKRGAKK